MTTTDTRAAARPAAVGADTRRIEGTEKVSGAASYAADHHHLGDVAHLVAVPSRIAKGRVGSIDAAAALALPGVLAVLTHENTPRLSAPDNRELEVLQGPEVAYRGQFVAAVVATSLETAREVADGLRIEYAEEDADTAFRADHPAAYVPAKVNPAFPAVTEVGDLDAELAAAAVRVDETYTTPGLHNNALEPHATLAVWLGDELTVYESTQGAYSAQQTLAKLFGLEPDQVQVISPHVGGGFGSKGIVRANCVLAAVAARELGRPVRAVLSRAQLFTVVGHRTPTIQRIRLGADPDGRLRAIEHDVQERTSTVLEFAEQTAVATRIMYPAAAVRTKHRLVALDVPTPRWMRAPGECPGMFALESALDELAVAAGVDPVALRLTNDTDVDPESGKPFSSRSLGRCLTAGAERFGWAGRDPRPGVRREGRWLVGTGVASSTYPAYAAPATATASAQPDGRYVVRIAAADIGTGARTVLTQVAADALGVRPADVTVEIGDSSFGMANLAGGSMGTASWSWAVTRAGQRLRAELDERGGTVPDGGLSHTADTTEEVQGRGDYSFHGFGAQFAEARVDPDTGEVRVSRLLGMFGVGRIVNPRTARSQLIGGMTMGLSMALHEEDVFDPAYGLTLNHDLAGYHVAAHADVPRIEVGWVDEHDEHVNPLGVKGIGEIGIVGTAAAVANAVHHATGVRIRDLPLRLDRVLLGLDRRAAG